VWQGALFGFAGGAITGAISGGINGARGWYNNRAELSVVGQPGEYLSKKAPHQATPGIKILKGQYVDKFGRVNFWETY
jgi:hypothetical protein